MGFNEDFEMYSKGSELLLGSARSGNTNDRNEGIRLLKNAGNNGITRASYLLGQYYEKIEDYQEGAKWYSKAVNDPDCGDEAHTTLELWILERKIRSIPSTTAPAPATPSAPAPAQSSAPASSGVWQLIEKRNVATYNLSKKEGSYVKEGDKIILVDLGSGVTVDRKAGISGTIHYLGKDSQRFKAGEVIVEITPGEK